MNKNFKIDFIGIGTIRGGSTWIYEGLKEHPKIEMSLEKETHFFNDHNKFDKGVDYYKTFFHNKPNKIRGEFDPGYLNSKLAAKRIHETFPDAKLIVSLRNPVKRAYSHFLKHSGKGRGQIKNFYEITKFQNIYFDTGLYYSHLTEYLKYFKKDNILILIYEDLEENPLKFIQKIYSFLKIDSDFVPSNINTKINYLGYSKARIISINKILHNKKITLYSKKLMPKIFQNKLKKIRDYITNIMNIRKNNSQNKNYKKHLPEKTRKFLTNKYQNEITNLENLIGRDLSLWK